MVLWVTIENPSSGLVVALSSDCNGAQLQLEVLMFVMMMLMRLVMTMLMMIVRMMLKMIIEAMMMNIPERVPRQGRATLGL